MTLTKYENYLAQQLPVVYQPNYANPFNEIATNLTGATPLNVLQAITPENWRSGELTVTSRGHVAEWTVEPRGRRRHPPGSASRPPGGRRRRVAPTMTGFIFRRLRPGDHRHPRASS